jgi:hypothetical protein
MTTSERDADASENSTALAAKECTPAEKNRIANYHQRIEKKPIKYKTPKDGSRGLLVEVDSVEKASLMLAVLTEALGTPDVDLQTYLLDQVVRTFRGFVSADGQDDEHVASYANNAMALLNGIEPRDEIEGMLAVQMIAVHNVAMEQLKRAMITGQTFAGEDANVNRATKMLRTFTMQMEALKRYRTGGQQKVVVEHVHVNEGGQAIVGAVSTGGGGNDRKPE